MSTEELREQTAQELRQDPVGKINVITSETSSISELGVEEREQLFDKLSKDNKLLPRELFMTFRGVHDAHIPTLPEALLRVIINESAAIQASGGDHLIPHTNMLVLPILAQQMTVGGDTTTTPGQIRVAFDIPTKALAPDGSPRNVSAGTNVAVVGVRVQGCGGDMSPKRCLHGPDVHPGAYVMIDGLPVELPHQFDFSTLGDSLGDLLKGILKWVRWVGESSMRQAVLVYHGDATGIRGEKTARSPAYKATPVACPEDLVIFDSLGYFETGCTFHQTTRMQMRSTGLERAYDALIINGRESAATYIDVWKNTRTLEQWERNAVDKIRTEKLAAKTYALIIDKKFGADRRKKFLADVKRMRGKSPQDIMKATMKPSEVIVIATEYKRREEYLEAVVNNKCPHLRAARTFQRAVSDEEISAAYNALKGYFAKTTSDSKYIDCNKCGFGIICPHKKLLIEMDLKRSPTSTVKAAISQYIGSGGPGVALFCRVCGETLTGLDALESYEAPRISHNDELAQFMWGEIAPIMRHFRFGPQINVSQLITTVRDSCYQYIFDIEKRLIRSKTSSAQEILAKKKLYIDIYGFAYMIMLIVKNPGGQIEFRGESRARTGGAGRAPAANKAAGSKASIVDLIKGITSTLVLSRNLIIREIRGMTPETIRNALIDAYKILNNALSVSNITTSDVNEDIAADVLLGVVYEMFYRASVFADLIAGKPAPKSEFDIITRLSDIMGGRLERLCGKTPDCSIFANARVPRWNIKKPAVGSMWVGREPLFKSAAGWNFARGFELFAERVITKMYTEHVWKPVDIHMLDDYTHVSYTERIQKYIETIEEFIETTDLIDRSRRLWACQMYGSVGENKRRKITPVGLDRLYGVDGHLHKWDKVVIGTETLVDADFITAVAKGTPLQARNRSDVICSICGMKRSETGGNAHNGKITEVLRKQVETANFYRFYENRCPTGGNHDYKDKTCAKCGLVRGQQTPEYFEKWHDAYSAEKSEMNDIADTAREEPVAAPKVSTVDWSFDYNMITKFADVFEVRPKIIMALGIPEIIDWNAITAGTWTPPVLDHRDHPRVFALRGIFTNVIREYNKLRMFKRIFKVPQSLITLIELAGVNRSDMNTLADQLPAVPPIDKDWPDVYATRAPAEIVEWLLEKICELFLWFSEQSGPVKALMDKFAREYVKDLIRSEELTSKPGYFNWSLLYGDSLSVDESRDEKRPKESADDDDDASTPFSMDAYDMETNGDDEDETTVHVGDELGM